MNLGTKNHQGQKWLQLILAFPKNVNSINFEV